MLKSGAVFANVSTEYFSRHRNNYNNINNNIIAILITGFPSLTSLSGVNSWWVCENGCGQLFTIMDHSLLTHEDAIFPLREE